jgi:hypothetical protein
MTSGVLDVKETLKGLLKEHLQFNISTTHSKSRLHGYKMDCVEQVLTVTFDGEVIDTVVLASRCSEAF